MIGKRLTAAMQEPDGTVQVRGQENGYRVVHCISDMPLESCSTNGEGHGIAALRPWQPRL